MPKLVLVYATNSGNTEYVAQVIEQVFARHQLDLEVVNVGYAAIDDAVKADLLILGSCTWEKRVNGERLEGQLQDQMEHFVEQLGKHSLKHHKVAVFGLGDSDYKYFCGAAILLNQFVESAGVNKMGSTMYVDSWPQPQQDKIEAWATEIIHAYQQK